MQEFSKVGIDSKRTTAASVAIVGLVVYLALIHLQSILMPLAIAILLYFMIKPPEQLIYQKVNNRFVSYGTVILTFIITIYFISIFLYDNLSQFIDEVPEITAAFEEKRAKYADADLYGLEVIFSDADLVTELASPSNVETFVLAILGSLGGFFTTMVTVLIFLLFIVLEEHTIAQRFGAAFPNSYDRAKKIVSESTESITAYVVSKVTCSAGQALVMTIIISPIGFDLPGWFLFGILCFLLDFIWKHNSNLTNKLQRPKFDNINDPFNMDLEPPALFFHPSEIKTFVNSADSLEIYGLKLDSSAAAHLEIIYDYGSIIVDSVSPGPFFQNSNDTIEVIFDFVGSGLTFKGELEGFEIAGEEDQFFPAKADIMSESISKWKRVKGPIGGAVMRNITNECLSGR